MHTVRLVDVERFRETLRKLRQNEVPNGRGMKVGRPALSKLTDRGAARPVNSQTIKNIEDGRIVDPGLVTVARIVDALGLSLTEFFAHVEGVTSAVIGADQGSDLPAVPEGGSRDVPASPDSSPVSRAEIAELQQRIETLEADLTRSRRLATDLVTRSAPARKKGGKTKQRRA